MGDGHGHTTPRPGQSALVGDGHGRMTSRPRRRMATGDGDHLSTAKPSRRRSAMATAVQWQGPRPPAAAPRAAGARSPPAPIFAKQKSTTLPGPTTIPMAGRSSRPADRRKHSRPAPSARAGLVKCVVCPPNPSPIPCLTAASPGRWSPAGSPMIAGGGGGPPTLPPRPPAPPGCRRPLRGFPALSLSVRQGGAGKAKTSRRTRGLPG